SRSEAPSADPETAPWPSQSPITRNNAATPQQDVALPQVAVRIPIQRCAAVAQPGRLQLGEPLTATGAAAEDRELVADQFATTVGEDRGQAGEACPLLLADAGREPSQPTAISNSGAKDRRVGAGEGVDEDGGHNEISVTRTGGSESCLGNAVKRQDSRVFDFPGKAITAPCGEKTAPRGENATRRIGGWRLAVD